MNINAKQFFWTERYRPMKIDDCILPEALKARFKGMVEQGAFQHLLLAGGAGMGKTTVAKALCEELEIDYLYINASKDGNIDTLRTTITQYGSTVSAFGGRKCIILDEADYLNMQSTQPALRVVMEEFSRNVSFILTANYKNRIMKPIAESRCTPIDFKIPKAEKPKLAAQFMKRLEFILKNENVKYDAPVLAQLINQFFPDFRRLINEIQKYSVTGPIDAGILAQIGNVKVTDLITALRAKEFPKVRSWVVQNLDNDSDRLFRSIYDSLSDHLTPASIPQAILILAEYQYKAAFAADQEINLVAALINLMCDCEFR